MGLPMNFRAPHNVVSHNRAGPIGVFAKFSSVNRRDELPGREFDAIYMRRSQPGLEIRASANIAGSFRMLTRPRVIRQPKSLIRRFDSGPRLQLCSELPHLTSIEIRVLG